MKKIRIRKRAHNLFVIMMVFIVTITSVGYGLLNESIGVSGLAVANYVISGNVLKLNMTANGTSPATYSKAGTFPTNFSTFTSEVLAANYLTLTFTRNKTTSTYQNCNFTITFKNPYPYQMTGGARTNTTVTGGSNVNSFASTLGATTLAIGASTTLNVTVRLRTSVTTVIQLQVRIAYTIQGVTQYFYYVIKVL